MKHSRNLYNERICLSCNGIKWGKKTKHITTLRYRNGIEKGLLKQVDDLKRYRRNSKMSRCFFVMNVKKR